MLDRRNGWQDDSGGWWQTSGEDKKPDLWATVYAVKLLDYANRCGITAFQGRIDVTEAIERSFSFLETEWFATRWGDPGRLLVEENLVSLFIEIAPLVARYSPRLETECVAAMTEWLSPGGDLSRTYLATLEAQDPPVHAEQAYARMAYAFYLAGSHSVDWRAWFEKAARGSLCRLFSSELAFLLDLSFPYNVQRPRPRIT